MNWYHIIKDEKILGRVSGYSSGIAAKKAFSILSSRLQQNKITFCIRKCFFDEEGNIIEIGKETTYMGIREEIDPIDISIKTRTGLEKPINFSYNNKVVKLEDKIDERKD